MVSFIESSENTYNEGTYIFKIFYICTHTYLQEKQEDALYLLYFNFVDLSPQTAQKPGILISIKNYNFVMMSL